MSTAVAKLPDQSPVTLRRGRPPGTPNKTSKQAKDNIVAVFDKMGGVPRMLKWANANPDDFYSKVYPKLLAIQVVGAGPNGEHLITPVLNVTLSDDG